MVTRECPTCHGTGTQTLGMSLGEAVQLALTVTETDGWVITAISARIQPPDGQFYVVIAASQRFGGTQIEMESPEAWQQRDKRIAEVLKRR